MTVEFVPTTMNPTIPRREDENELVTPSWGDALSAAFSTENDVVALYDLMRRPEFEPDPNFKLRDYVEREPELFQQFPNAFSRVRSEQEFNFAVGRIREEQENQQILAQSGGAGILAAIAAGIISPTAFIPLVGATAKGGKAFVQGAAYGAGAGAIQAGILEGAQYSRDANDFIFDVTAGTVIGGLLGGGVGLLRKGAMERIEADMVEPKPGTYIPALDNINSSETGAAVVDPTPLAGGVKDGAIVTAPSRVGRKITESPVIQAIQQKDFETGSTFMQQLSNAGLVLERNADDIATARGGNVENSIKQWYRGFAKSVDALDKSYRDYVLGDDAVPIFRNTRAVIQGGLSSTKLNRHEFNIEVSRAIWRGDAYEGPSQVRDAAKALKEVLYDPMLAEALRVGLITSEQLDNLSGDAGYLNRMYDSVAIERDKSGFIEIVKRNFLKQLDTRFAAQYARLQQTQARARQEISDAQLPVEDIAQLRSEFIERLEDLENSPLQETLDEISELEGNARALGTQGNLRETPEGRFRFEEDAAPLRAKARELKQRSDVKAFKEEKAALKQRLRNFNKSYAAAAEKLSGKLSRIDRIEELQLNSLGRLERAAKKLDRDLDKISDDVLEIRLLKLNNQFDKTADLYRKGEDRLLKLSDDPEFEKILKIDAAQEIKIQRLNGLAHRMRDTEDLLDNRVVLREMLEDFHLETRKKINDLNGRRAVRIVKLEEQAKKLTPEAIAARIDGLESKLNTRETKFIAKFEKEGGEVDFEAGTADFNAIAVERARQVTDNILGTYSRLPGIDILQGERGAALSRVLDIPSEELEDFLHTDIEFLMRSYLRTMSSDIEMMRRFGSPNADTEFQRLALEFEQKQAAAKSQKEKDRLVKEYNKTRDNLEVVVARLRHTYGIPDNPYAASVRLARAVQNINTLRFMGSVAISSLPDMAMVVIKNGLANTMRHAVIPLITNLKNFNLSAKEARMAGVALDTIIHTRAHQLFDILDDYGRSTKGERILEYTTGKIGMVGLFDYWTSGMKQLAAVTTNAQFVSIMEKAAKGKLSKKELTRINAVGIDSDMAEQMWRLISETEGGGKVNGVWLPNTEDWTRPEVYTKAGMSEVAARELQRSYRAALANRIDDTIVTPGVERPPWMDGKSLGFRLMGQLRSFAFSSTSKVLMAGMQQRDMALVNGIMFSLALGGLSYYTWAMTSGGRAKKEMLEADMDKWLDEMISRSGLIGWLADAQNIASEIPGLSDKVTFSGERVTRSPFNSPVAKILGPTWDLVERLERLVQDADDPTQSTLRTIRRLTPFQNVFYLRQLFDLLEEGAGDALNLPETRQ